MFNCGQMALDMVKNFCPFVFRIADGMEVLDLSVK
jgi:hypothetical protein